jgi:hypothetical protein
VTDWSRGGETSCSQRGRSAHSWKALRFARSVISSSAPPSMKSNATRGSRRLAIARTSSMFLTRRMI